MKRRNKSNQCGFDCEYCVLYFVNIVSIVTVFDVTRILSLRLIECHGIVSIVSVFNRVL